MEARSVVPRPGQQPRAAAPRERAQHGRVGAAGRRPLAGPRPAEVVVEPRYEPTERQHMIPKVWARFFRGYRHQPPSLFSLDSVTSTPAAAARASFKILIEIDLRNDT